MVGNFNDGSVPGKMQYGPPWWFLDQRHGIVDHLNTLSNFGLLSRFIGMVTDSRSFLSLYSRHEYFRRVLCNVLGGEMESGLLPHDMDMVGSVVRAVCSENAIQYLGLEASGEF
jgi:glucuronate isomerase